MNITVEQTLEMPDVVLFARKLQTALEDEKRKRRHFYEIVGENKKMEFINGEIVFHSPATLCEARTFGNLLNLISTFVSKNKLGEVIFGKALVSLSRNDYEPDVCFFGVEKAKSFAPRQAQFPVPDLVVEVLSDSTEKNDREIKFQDYAAHGVGEYWIVDPEKQTVEQYVLENGNYELAVKAKDGEIASVILPEFKIPIRAVFDEKINLETLRKLIAD